MGRQNNVINILLLINTLQQFGTAKISNMVAKRINNDFVPGISHFESYSNPTSKRECASFCRQTPSCVSFAVSTERCLLYKETVYQNMKPDKGFSYYHYNDNISKKTELYLSIKRASYDESAKRCAGKGGRLATILDEKTQNLATAKIKAWKYFGSAWFGLRGMVHREKYRYYEKKYGTTWALSWSDGTSFNISSQFRNFANGYEPDRSEEMCFAIDGGESRHPGKWIPTDCVTVLYYLCELDKNAKK